MSKGYMLLHKIKRIVRNKFPNIHKFIVYNFYFRGLYYSLSHYFLLKEISRRKIVNVVFFASTLSMWRYQKLYDILSKDDRFICNIIIHPFCTYTLENQRQDVETLKRYFTALKINFHDAFDSKQETLNWIARTKPDLLFYPQAYTGIFNDEFESKNFAKRLLCYYPYGIVTFKDKGLYNEFYQNIAWKVFCPTKYHLIEAKEFMANNGRNVVISGDPVCDFENHSLISNKWKIQKNEKKKIIWAPHYTLNGNNLLHRASFLWMSDYMVYLANKYKDQIQISFKPHPRLKTELYSHPDWGKDRTDKYYNIWKVSENTQLDEGEYIDLFLTSDAMIHDSGSFTAEYLYTKKPIAFTSTDSFYAYNNLNDFGIKCMNLHYMLQNTEDVEVFIQKIINDFDEKRPQREKFFNEVLKSPNGKSVAQNTYDSIVLGLKL